MTKAAGDVTLSVILPAYNAAELLPRSVETLRGFHRDLGIRGETVIVDDGSGDGTSDAIEEASDVRVLRFERNCGKGAAVRAGMAASRGRVCVMTDADLPYGTPPLAAALHYINCGFHAVIGDRTHPLAHDNRTSSLRRLVSGFAALAFRTLLVGDIGDTQCGFKAVRGDLAREFYRLARIDRFATDVEILYLLRRYRLDIKRIPVHLVAETPSTVRVVRDSARVLVDSLRIIANGHLGHYDSTLALEVLEQERERSECAGRSEALHSKEPRMNANERE